MSDLGNFLRSIIYLEVYLGRLVGKIPTAGTDRGADLCRSSKEFDGQLQLLRHHARRRCHFHLGIMDLRNQWPWRLSQPPSRIIWTGSKSIQCIRRHYGTCRRSQQSPTFWSTRGTNLQWSERHPIIKDKATRLSSNLRFRWQQFGALGPSNPNRILVLQESCLQEGACTLLCPGAFQRWIYRCLSPIIYTLVSRAHFSLILWPAWWVTYRCWWAPTGKIRKNCRKD